MLENNTDRSFWMVGSIIVGAALITSAKPAFKAILDLITTWFKKMISDTTNSNLTGATIAPALGILLPQVVEAATRLIH